MLLGDLRGNSVHVGGTLLGQSLSVDALGSILVLELELANKTSSFELHHAVSNALSSAHSVVLSVSAVSLVSTVVLSEGVDTNLASNVELVGDGGSSDVEPVGIIGSEVPGAGSLVVGGPLYVII